MRLFGSHVRGGFTIVELMMVIGIIGILLGIVTTAASSSIQQARTRKADAACTLVEQAFATFYAQKGYWPGTIGTKIKNGNLGERENYLGEYSGGQYQTDHDQYELDADEVDSMVRDIIQETKNGNPLMDISGLFVSRGRGYKDGRDHGLDFMDAIHGTRKSAKKMKVSEMHFGYPETSTGYFRHFWIIYSIPTDTFKVSRMNSSRMKQQ